MSTPDLSEVIEAARGIVGEAKREGKLNVLTKRLVRQEVEQVLSLTPGTLDAKEFKHTINDTIGAAIEDVDIFHDSGSVVREKKSSKSKNAVEKVPNASTFRSADDTQRPSVKRKRSSKGAKSAEVVLDSDAEDWDATPNSNPAISSVKSKKINNVRDSSITPKKRRQEQDESKEESKVKKDRAATLPVISDRTKEGLEQSSDDVHSSTNRKSNAVSEDVEIKSDSEMSVLIDEPPKRSQKIKDKESKTKGTKEKKTREGKAKVELSKDEEYIKKLKGLVFACGVRKNWVKELADKDKPATQIKRLKEILAELGMTGRLSMEQAKAIKEKRELEKELQDVHQFAEQFANAGRASRSHTKAATVTVKGKTPEDDSDDDSEPEPRKKRNAARSIMAFLEDQSDDD